MSALSMVQPISFSSTERDLIAAVRRGDDRAFEELYGRYRSRIGSYVFGMVGDHGRAEDIVQEAFISALRRLRATEHPIAFKPWMYEIAKNACIDEFRRTRRTQEVPLEASDDSDHGASGLLSSSPTPEAALEGKQRLDDLKGAFGGLSESHHRIIVMRELEGLSYSEIAEHMGMSRSMVESTLFRARRRLRGEYDELVSGRRCAQVQTAIEDGAPPLRNLRVRERRQLTRHLAHCRPCRRHALVAGVDESILVRPSLAGKVAAFFPFPFSLHWLHWPGAGARKHAVAGHGLHAAGALHSIPAAAPLTGAAGSLGGHGLVAAVASVVALAGVGGGVVVVSEIHHAHQAPLSRIASANRTADAGTRQAGTGGAARPSGRTGSGGAHHTAGASAGKNGSVAAVSVGRGSRSKAHRPGSAGSIGGGSPVAFGRRSGSPTPGTSPGTTNSTPTPPAPIAQPRANPAPIFSVPPQPPPPVVQPTPQAPGSPGLLGPLLGTPPGQPGTGTVAVTVPVIGLPPISLSLPVLSQLGLPALQLQLPGLLGVTVNAK